MGFAAAALFGGLRRLRRRCEDGDDAAHQQNLEDSFHHTCSFRRSVINPGLY